MSDEEIEKIYRLISEKYESNLKKFGVKKINLKAKNGNYTKDALVLVYLARDYPKTQAISKQELTEFVRKFYPNVSDVQQARHLAKQKGYNIISGTRGDINEKIAPASYKLLNLEYPYPSFKQDRRSGINAKDFEGLKKQYNYRCATCGSIENQPHNIRNNEITKLQAGHMNPSKPLVFGNIIPQCQVCNRPDRDRFIYDKTGRAIEIANSDDGKRVVERYLKKVSKNTKEYFLDLLKRLLKIK